MPELSIENSFTPLNPASVNSAALEKRSDELDQSDFIQLLVAQVKNQDPTKPMDPSEFMNQLTQSSMVNGLNELQGSFDDLAVKLSSDQSLQAAGLVGKSVLIAGGDAQLNSGSTISGQINLQQQASEVNLNIFNSRGEQVRTLPLGGHGAGSLQFKWDGFADDGSVALPGDYTVTAEALIGGTQQAIAVSLEKRIESISINNGSDGSATGTLLNLSSGQQVTLADITQIK
jgi:flagellar basal-body rod modification protein FlgD